MKRSIAKLLIDAKVNADNVSMDEARSALPNWVQRLVESDQEVGQYWELCCLLDAKAKGDAAEFCQVFNKQQAFELRQHDECAPTVQPASSNGVAGKVAVAVLVSAATLAGLALIPFLNSDSEKPLTAKPPEKLDVDIRPLLATASASHKVLMRLSSAAEESIAVLERSADELNLEAGLPDHESAEELLKNTKESWQSSVRQAVGLLTMKQ